MPIFRKGRRKPSWVHNVEGVLWRVVPTGRGLLVCETRELEKRQTTFFCIKQTNGQVLWSDASLREQWWIGIEGVHEGTLFLHKFAQPDMPEHCGIIAVEIESGRVLWQNDGWKFEGVSESSLVASRKGLTGEMFFEIDFRSGIVQGEFGSEEAFRQALRSTTSGTPESVKFPSLLPDVPQITSMIRRHCGAETLVGPVEYVELSPLLVFSYHARSSSSTPERMLLDHRLNVVSQSEVLFSETINHNTSAVVPESFFVEDDMLFFVRERTKLTAVQL